MPTGLQSDIAGYPLLSSHLLFSRAVADRSTRFSKADIGAHGVPSRAPVVVQAVSGDHTEVDQDAGSKVGNVLCFWKRERRLADQGHEQRQVSIRGKLAPAGKTVGQGNATGQAKGQAQLVRKSASPFLEVESSHGAGGLLIAALSKYCGRFSACAKQ